MRTEDLIDRLASDNARRGMAPGTTLALAVSLGTVIAAALMLTTIGPRADIARAASTWRFDYKFLVTILLTVSSIMVLRKLVYPQAASVRAFLPLLAAPLALLGAVLIECAALPADAWRMAATGKNALLCMTIVPALGIVPLALMIWAVRQGAAARPALAGFLAGLVSGGIAATFYAANCTDDSPLFVASWYPLSIGMLAIVGSIAGRYAARW